MLSYEEFKNTFCVRFPEVMGPEYDDYELKLMPVVKRGKTLDGFTFCPKDKEGKTTVMPTFYFEDLYDAYSHHNDLTRELYEISDSMKNAITKGISMSEDISLKTVKKNVIAELVNPEVCRAYIDGIPHREFLNLYIIYRWVLNIDESGVYSGIIDNELMSAVEMDEQMLYECAMRNTRKMIVPQIKNFDTVVRGMMRREGSSESEIKRVTKNLNKDNRVYMLTNKYHFKASTALIYSEVLDQIARKADSDYYIVPTSVNESLIVPVKAGIEPEKLQEMLTESNNYYFSNDDNMLSDTVYYYDRNESVLLILENEEVRA